MKFLPILAILLTLGSLAMAADAPAPKSVLRHVVAFKFKESATKDMVAQIEKEFRALKTKIPEIKGYEWGMNNSPEGLNKGCTHGFILTFNSEKDRDTYLNHPQHKAFGGLVKTLLDDVFVMDFWTKE